MATRAYMRRCLIQDASFGAGKTAGWASHALRRPTTLRHRLKAGSLQRGTLALSDAVDGEFLDRFAEKAMKVELRVKVQEHPAEADRRAVHEHELARHPHRPFLPEGAVDQ